MFAACLLKTRSELLHDKRYCMKNKVDDHKQPRTSASTNLYRILLAEDDKEMLVLHARGLHKAGYRVMECNNGWELHNQIESLTAFDKFENIDLIISDICMPGIAVFQILESARSYKHFPPVILITTFLNKKILAHAKQLDAAALFAHPFDIDALLTKVYQIIPFEFSSEKQLHQTSHKVELGFHLDISFRRTSSSEPVKSFILEMARELSLFRDYIKHVRIVIDEYTPHEYKKHYYHINIKITTIGKPVVVKHDTGKGTGEKNLYIGLQIVFTTALRQLKQYLGKRYKKRIIRRGLSISPEVDN